MFPVLAPTPRALQPLLAAHVPPRAFPLLAATALRHEPLAVVRLVLAAAAWLLILANIAAHYCFTVTGPPGTVRSGGCSSVLERRLGPGSAQWWFASRKRAARSSPHSLRTCPDPVVVPSKQIKLLQATETTVRQWAEPPCIPPPPLSRTSIPSVVSAAPTSLTDDSSSFLQSSPQTPEPLLSQHMSSPCEAGSPKVLRYTDDATPQPVRDDSMPDSDDLSRFEALVMPRKGHRLSQSTSALPPPARRNSRILIAPTPRAGAIHHMPTQQPDTGNMGRSYSMVSASSHVGPHHASSTLGEPTQPAVLFESHSYDPVLDDLDSDDFFPMAKMCHLCPKVPLFKALAALPPEMRLMEHALRSQELRPRHPMSSLDAFEPVWTDGEQEGDVDGETDMETDVVVDPALSIDETEEDIIAWLGEEQAWQLVPPPKPERAHHCPVCNTCVFKYDHHSRWLNCCIGLGNERSFVLLLSWAALANILISLTGLPVVRLAWESSAVDWPFSVPRVCVVFTWLAAVGLALALTTTALHQVRLAARGETRVEFHENQYYAQLAWRRQRRFQNVYSLGPAQNLRLFFGTLADEPMPPAPVPLAASITRSPSSSSASPLSLHMRGHSHNHDASYCASPHARLDDPWKLARLLWPCRVTPYSDGWHWAKRRGLGGRHAGIEVDEELNDVEDAAAEAYSPF